MKRPKLTDKGEYYLGMTFQDLDDFRDEEYRIGDVISAINHCAELDGIDCGDEVYVFLAGVKYSENKIKHLKKKLKKEMK